MRRFCLIALLILAVVPFSPAADAPTSLPASPTPPAQATAGPGSSDYPFASLTFHRYGFGDSEYWIFEPANPTPKTAPLIIFDHGWSAMTPNTYGAWIKHLVRRGNIVIYPRYQASLWTPMDAFTPNAVAAVKAALLELQTGNHVKPDLTRVAIVGHSMGAAMAPNMAALAVADNLPIPKAICCVEPDNHSSRDPSINMPLADFSKIPAATLALVIVGDRDLLARDDTAKVIYSQINQIPPQNKDYLTLVSDTHGSPPLLANHLAPVALEILDPEAEQEFNTARLLAMRQLEQNSVDALDYYGTWKLFDGLTDAAFYNKNKEYALGNTPQQRYMGKWSDGTPVKELKVGQ